VGVHIAAYEVNFPTNRAGDGEVVPHPIFIFAEVVHIDLSGIHARGFTDVPGQNQRGSAQARGAERWAFGIFDWSICRLQRDLDE
jgi:hypothetical protein